MTDVNKPFTGKMLIRSQQFPKHLLEKTGLLRMLPPSGTSRITIDYNADTEYGELYVIADEDAAILKDHEDDIHRTMKENPI